jgi:hypothetical protein
MYGAASAKYVVGKGSHAKAYIHVLLPIDHGKVSLFFLFLFRMVKQRNV